MGIEAIYRRPNTRRQRQSQAVALIQLAQRLRPGVFGVGIQAYFSHSLGDINVEFVGGCVLTGVQARAAVMAQVRHVMDIGLSEFQAPGHRRKYRAKTFAITTGVADGHLPLYFTFVKIQHRDQCARCLGIKQLHVETPSLQMTHQSRPKPLPAHRRCDQKRYR